MVDTLTIPAFNAPGAYSRNMVSDMINLGARLRDDYAWKYPILPGALFIYQQMIAGREYKMSGKPTHVSRGLEYLEKTQCSNQDGTTEYGMEPFLKRRALDHVAIGRSLFTWGNGKPLRYIDPVTCRYDVNQKRWVDYFSQEKFKSENMGVNHAIPVGNTGNFISPLSFVVPTAMLAWLVREHDMAAADGRKIKDVMVVAGEEFAKSIGSAIEDALNLWSGADPTKHDVPIAFVDLSAMQGNIKIADLIARVGLANIPDNFNRADFMFAYVNEIAAALGLALRYFWNAEKATNRALEEVQEARQNQKGPSAFIRSEQRLYNGCGMFKQFGSEVRFGFVEEVDIASQQINATILKLYAEALQIFVKSLSGTIQPDQLVAWLQREDILPADLDVIKTSSKIINPEVQPTPVNGNTVTNSDSLTGIQKSLDEIDYDEITVNSKGEVIDRRVKVFSFQKAIMNELRAGYDGDPIIQIENTETGHERKQLWNTAVKKARNRLVEDFIAFSKGCPDDEEVSALVQKSVSSMTPEDFKKMRMRIDGIKT